MKGEKAGAGGAARPRVLLVDDEEAVRRASARVLSAEGFEIVEAGDRREALAHLERGQFDVVVSDVMVPNVTAWIFCAPSVSGTLSFPSSC